MPLTIERPDQLAMGAPENDSKDLALAPGRVQPNQPGSLLYHRWAEQLREGQITYDEFIDWITPMRRPTLMQRVLQALRR